MILVKQQAQTFLQSLRDRRRNPVKPATLRIYKSYIQNWIVPRLGQLSMAEIENGVMRNFVSYLVNAHLTPSTVNGVIGLLKSIVSSVVDENGNRVYNRVWNSSFLDIPKIEPSEQETPTIDQISLNKCLRRSWAPYTAFYALQAASGLRMSEMMALRMGPDTGTGSFLDYDKMTLFVRSAISYAREEQTTKSLAGVREVDLHPTILDWLRDKFPGRAQGDLLFQSGAGGPWYLSTLYEHTFKDGVPGTHCLRRFRTTHLENMSVPRVLVDYWVGHAGHAITDRYTKLGRSIEARKNWCRKAGLGFQLPGTTEDVIVDLYAGTDAELQEVL